MSLSENKTKKKIIKISVSLLCVVMILLSCCAFYLGDYYHADMEAIEAFSASYSVKQEIIGNDNIVLDPGNAKKGLIFYPGGKVEYTTYLPLMQSLASEGILCVLVKMPFNLAVFDINAADGIQNLYPEIENWYIGGHSLGGSMAAYYLADNAESFDGLILLGSYSTEDLSSSSLKVLSVYGSEDTVMNMEKYNECEGNLPDGFTQVIIDGGCHAYFGMYGQQKGDGTPKITNDEQIYKTAQAISDHVLQQ